MKTIFIIKYISRPRLNFSHQNLILSPTFIIYVSRKYMNINGPNNLDCTKYIFSTNKMNRKSIFQFHHFTLHRSQNFVAKASVTK